MSLINGSSFGVIFEFIRSKYWSNFVVFVIPAFTNSETARRKASTASCKRFTPIPSDKSFEEFKFSRARSYNRRVKSNLWIMLLFMIHSRFANTSVSTEANPAIISFRPPLQTAECAPPFWRSILLDWIWLDVSP